MRGGGKNSPPTQPYQEQMPNGSDRAAPRGATAMGTVEAAARMETGSGGTGQPAAHPTGEASAAAAGVLVGWDRACQGDGTNDDAGNSPA